jgi:hypothetical protein
VHVYRDLYSRAWPPNWDKPAGPMSTLREVLDFFDATPPSRRVDIGRFVHHIRALVDSEARAFSPGVYCWSTGWLFFYVAVVAEDGSARGPQANAKATEFAVAQAQHYSRTTNIPVAGLMLVYDLGDGKTAFDGSLCETHFGYWRPAPQVSQKALSYVVHQAGALGLDGSSAPLRAGRNERCPCGSGYKFKRCKFWKDHILGSPRFLTPDDPEYMEPANGKDD